MGYTGDILVHENQQNVSVLCSFSAKITTGLSHQHKEVNQERDRHGLHKTEDPT